MVSITKAHISILSYPPPQTFPDLPQEAITNETANNVALILRQWSETQREWEVDRRKKAQERMRAKESRTGPALCRSVLLRLLHQGSSQILVILTFFFDVSFYAVEN